MRRQSVVPALTERTMQVHDLEYFNTESINTSRLPAMDQVGHDPIVSTVKSSRNDILNSTMPYILIVVRDLQFQRLARLISEARHRLHKIVSYNLSNAYSRAYSSKRYIGAENVSAMVRFGN